MHHSSGPVHRVVLASASKYFANLFESELKKEPRGDIPLHDISGAMLKKLIDFCYIGTFDLDCYNVDGIFHYANQYCLPHLKNKCRRYLADRISSKKCGFVLAFGEMQKIIACEYICNNFVDFIQTDAFDQLDIEPLISILQSDDIEKSEEEVKWIKFDESKRISHFKQLMTTLRTGGIETKVSLRLLHATRQTIDKI